LWTGWRQLAVGILRNEGLHAGHHQAIWSTSQPKRSLKGLYEIPRRNMEVERLAFVTGRGKSQTGLS